MKRKGERKEKSIPLCACIGIGTAIVFCLLLSLVITALILNEKIGESAIGVSSIAITAITTFIGAFLAARLAEKGVVPTVAITAAGILAAIICSDILFFDSSFEQLAGKSIAILAAAALACLLSLKTAGRKGRRVRHR